MADDCERLCKRHRGPGGMTDPALDPIMESLLENQKGKGRHKCTYCAYELGLERGREEERARIAGVLGLRPPDGRREVVPETGSPAPRKAGIKPED